MEKQILHLPDADIYYFPGFLRKEIAEKYFRLFLKELHWQQKEIKIFGKKIPQPRLTGFYAENQTPYTYSSLTLKPEEFTPELEEIRKKLLTATGISFTHCLANLYRDGNDSMGWHADDEKVLGKNPVIASVSLGAKRKFQMKHKGIKDLKTELELEEGSLLLMQGPTQHHWKHQLPKTQKYVGPRINLTFRKIF